MVILKKFATSSYDLDKRIYESGLGRLKNMGIVEEDQGSRHPKIEATDYFKNNFINTRILDRLPDGSPGTVENGIKIGGEPLTLIATIKTNKSTIFGGSAKAWDELLASIYMLSKNDAVANGLNIKKTVSEIYEKCFNSPITTSLFFGRDSVKKILDKSNDIVLNNKLLLNDFIINLIKRFKENSKIGTVNIFKEINIADRQFFGPYIESKPQSDRNSAFIEVNAARKELEDILRGISDFIIDQPRVVVNTIKNNFEDDMSVIVSLMDSNGKNLYSIDDFYQKYKELAPDKFNEFISNYSKDGDKQVNQLAENQLKNIFEIELNNLADKSTVISREANNLYSIIAFKDKVLASLSKLYFLMPPIEKKSIINEMFNYMRK